MDGYWLGKRVFVTGATGVMGAWLVEELTRRGADVICLVRDWAPRSRFFTGGLAGEVTLAQGDLQDHGGLERILNEYEVDTVFHLGAQTIVGAAARSPLATFESNIRGTWNVLEAARLHRADVCRVVVASSDKAYGDHGRCLYTEDMALQGRHPYEVSKSCADLLAQAYAETYGLPVAITRFGNIFGGGDLNFSRIIPGTIRAALAGRRPIIRSDGTPVRNYVYVRDAVDGYLTLAEALDRSEIVGQAFNFCSEECFGALEIVERVLVEAGRPDLEPVILGGAFEELPFQASSSEKAERLLGWRTRWSLDEGLRETIEWYRRHLPVDNDGSREVKA